MKTKTSMTTKRLQSIAKHVASMLKQSQAIDLLAIGAAALVRKENNGGELTEAEEYLIEDVQFAADCIDDLRCEVKEVESLLNRAARSYGKVKRGEAKGRKAPPMMKRNSLVRE